MKHSQLIKLITCLESEMRIYDNGGKTLDRYTAVYMCWPECHPGTYQAVGMSENPFQGFGQHCSAKPGKHLGSRIKFSQLPYECQKLIIQDLTYEKN